MNPVTLAVLKIEEAAGEAAQSRGIGLAERAPLLLDWGIVADAVEDDASDAAAKKTMPANSALG